MKLSSRRVKSCSQPLMFAILFSQQRLRHFCQDSRYDNFLKPLPTPSPDTMRLFRQWLSLYSLLLWVYYIHAFEHRDHANSASHDQSRRKSSSVNTSNLDLLDSSHTLNANSYSTRGHPTSPISFTTLSSLESNTFFDRPAGTHLTHSKGSTNTNSSVSLFDYKLTSSLHPTSSTLSRQGAPFSTNNHASRTSNTGSRLSTSRKSSFYSVSREENMNRYDTQTARESKLLGSQSSLLTGLLSVNQIPKSNSGSQHQHGKISIYTASKSSASVNNAAKSSFRQRHNSTNDIDDNRVQAMTSKASSLAPTLRSTSSLASQHMTARVPSARQQNVSLVHHKASSKFLSLYSAEPTQDASLSYLRLSNQSLLRDTSTSISLLSSHATPWYVTVPRQLGSTFSGNWDTQQYLSSQFTDYRPLQTRASSPTLLISKAGRLSKYGSSSLKLWTLWPTTTKLQGSIQMPSSGYGAPFSSLSLNYSDLGGSRSSHGTVYAFLNTMSLVLPTFNKTSSVSSTAQSTKSSASTNAPLSPTFSGTISSPSSMPVSILPAESNRTRQAGAVLISILFKSTIPWVWITTQRETTAQIFTYMPQIIAHAIQCDASDVSTVQLRRFSPANSPVDIDINARFRTLYMAYLPMHKSKLLSSLIHDVNSLFYEPDGGIVPQQIVREVDPSFNLFEFSQKPGNGATGSISDETRDALVGSFVGVGGAVSLGLLIWLVQRHLKQRKANAAKRASRTDTILSFGNDSPDPYLDGIEYAQPPQQMRSFFVGDVSGNPSDSVFEHQQGITGVLDVNEADNPYHSERNPQSRDVDSIRPDHDSYYAGLEIPVPTTNKPAYGGVTKPKHMLNMPKHSMRIEDPNYFPHYE